MKLNQIAFPKNQYYPEVQVKNQIVLHHTVSDPTSAVGDIGSWLSNPERIATYVVISADGTINKCFPSNQWAHHIGMKATELKAKGFEDFKSRNELLNKHSIGIELDCWGGLKEQPVNYFTKISREPISSGMRYLNAYGKPISNKLEVVKCDWRGFKYFQRYTDAQLAALAELLPILMKEYKIQNYGIMDGNFDVRMDALQGVSGIFSHSSYRSDKSDLYPDGRLISMLKNLNV